MWLLLGCAVGLRMPGPLGSLGDAPPNAPDAWQTPSARPVAPGNPIANAALGLLSARTLRVDGEAYRWDCSGFVQAALAVAGVRLTGSSADMYARAKSEDRLHHRKQPNLGDIAFFDDTYDKNGDGRRNDPLTHVAVVTEVSPDGTIMLAHLGNSGIGRLRMNLRHPDHASSPEGLTWNDPLRSRTRRDPDDLPVLTGQLWVGFGSFWGLSR